MNLKFLTKFLQVVTFVPSLVQGVEAIFGAKTGTQKQTAALDEVSASIGVAEAVANKDIMDETNFRAGLAKIVDGVVQCLNASVWYKRAAS